MRVITINGKIDSAVREAESILREGCLIAYPTESFYALGVFARDEEAVRRLYRLKKRPEEKPIPVIVGDMETLLSTVITVPFRVKKLMETYWPGPLNIIFEASDDLPSLLTAGLARIAVRIPGNETALRLARTCKQPITATSANLSDMRPARNADEVKRYFDDEVDLIIDGGETPGGMPSTIVDGTADPPVIIRKGSIMPEGF